MEGDTGHRVFETEFGETLDFTSLSLHAHRFVERNLVLVAFFSVRKEPAFQFMILGVGVERLCRDGGRLSARHLTERSPPFGATKNDAR